MVPLAFQIHLEHLIVDLRPPECQLSCLLGGVVRKDLSKYMWGGVVGAWPISKLLKLLHQSIEAVETVATVTPNCRNCRTKLPTIVLHNLIFI